MGWLSQVIGLLRAPSVLIILVYYYCRTFSRGLTRSNMKYYNLHVKCFGKPLLSIELNCSKRFRNERVEKEQNEQPQQGSGSRQPGGLIMMNIRNIYTINPAGPSARSKLCSSRSLQSQRELDGLDQKYSEENKTTTTRGQVESISIHIHISTDPFCVISMSVQIPSYFFCSALSV